MKRNYLIDEPIPLKHKDLILKTAFHEAGHVAAIYLNNKQKKLPPVYFQISLGGLSTVNCSEGMPVTSEPNWIATVEGGHLIHSLPVSVIESCYYFSQSESHAYQIAFEADVINLLAGPLAEAKFVAESDGEMINPRLVNVDALRYYGGTSDLAKVNEYLEDFIADPVKREEKLQELFHAAFVFVDNSHRWRAITRLAHYIINSNKAIISCEEAIDILDQSIVQVIASRI
jgi:hypothetical protein